jgi:uncharacterized protein YyaL (SSP411 family)
MADPKRPANKLIHETSPYLLQHAHNPVDWHSWSPEAIDLARRQDKPIFLSVGYSACHWCHVMERESFENEQIAALMNQHFINIKVDREERPDIDQIYMAAVQAMTGQGGWPMSVFLTPQLQPFYGGTYYPPDDRRGMPGFPRVIAAVADAWANRRDEIVQGAAQMTEQLRSLGRSTVDHGVLNPTILDAAFDSLRQVFDHTHGGFGSAPKFPHPMDLRVLLRHAHRASDRVALHMATLTLEKMARGGIYDHLGGGFARYSTDASWLVPHFEKMLYDNALLASTYLEAYQITRDAAFAQTARETLDYVLSRMIGAQGEIHSTEDADSEGVEGKYYVWTPAEIETVLGPDKARTFNLAYDVTPAGNWEHASILNLPRPLSDVARSLGRDASDLRAELADSRARLLAARETRVPPGKDTKVITAWNGLMIAALAEGARILDHPRYLHAAERAAGFLLDNLRDPAGRLLHTWKDGKARHSGFLDDHACLIDALTRLFEASANPRWLGAAIDLAHRMLDAFHDPSDGGFFYAPRDHEALIVRAKDATDNATPSGNAMAATALVRLGALTARGDLELAATRALQSAGTVLERYPSAAGQSLIALDFLLGPRREVVVVAGEDPNELDQALHQIASNFDPYRVVIPVTRASAKALESLTPLVHGRTTPTASLRTYICENQVCKAPIDGLAALSAAFASTASTRPSLS